MSEQDEKMMRGALCRLDWRQWILNHEAEYLALDDQKVFAIETALDTEAGGVFMIKNGLPMRINVPMPNREKIEVQIKKIDVRDLSDLDWDQWKSAHGDSEIMG